MQELTPNGDPVPANELVETEGSGGTTDGDTTNDPTVFTVPPAPALDVLKSVAAVNDLNGNSLIDVGDTVDYTFVVTNTGNVALANVTITDALVAVSGGPIALAIGADDTMTFTATYTLDEDDVTAGGVENTAVATGDAVDENGDPVLDPIFGGQLVATDDSDSGTDPLLDDTGAPVLQLILKPQTALIWRV